MLKELVLHRPTTAEELRRAKPRERRGQSLTERVTSIGVFPDVAEDVELGFDVGFPAELCVMLC